MGTRVSQMSGTSRSALGTSDVAGTEWGALVSSSAKVLSGGGDSDLLTVLTDEERGRLRFGRSYHARFEDILGPRWGKGLGLYFDVLPHDVRSELESTLRTLGVFKCTSSDQLRAILKPLSDYAKKFGSLFSEHWPFYVNIATVGGYLQPTQIEDFVDEVRQWVGGSVVHKSWAPNVGWSEELFLADLRTGLVDFFSDLPSRSSADARAPSLDEFVREPGFWAGSGASQIVYDARVVVGSESLKLRKNKWRSALGLSPATIRSMLLTRSPQHNKAIQKVEREKVRAVINADDASYLQMSFISLWLEAALANSTKSTLYMDKTQLADFWTDSAKEVRSGVNVPLDQSHFDWQQNSKMINLFLDVVEEVVRFAPHAEEYESVLGALRFKLNHGSVKVGSASIRIEKGVMSGWRWTALMDTAFNWAEMFAVRQLLMRMGRPTTVLGLNAQGDDDMVKVRHEGDALALIAGYAMLNFDINPSKFFISRTRDEYLRQVIRPGSVHGYPARAITSILWRNPVSSDPPAGIDRAREQLSSWNLLLARGCDRTAVLRLMQMDITRANGLSISDYTELLSTPASLGGLGFGVAGKLRLESGHLVDEGVLVGTHPGITLPDNAPHWWDYDDALAMFRSNVKTVKRSQTLVEGKINNVELRNYRLLLMRAENTYAHGYGGLPLAAYPSPGISVTYGMSMLEKAIRQRDWQWIRTVWLDSSLLPVSDRIERSGGRRVWVDWLLGKLPYSVPVVEGLSSLIVSRWYDMYAKAAWSAVVGKGAGFTYARMLDSAVLAEYQCRFMVQSLPVRIGG